MPPGARNSSCSRWNPTRTTILYVQPVAERGGSDQALVRMIRTLPRESYRCHVAVPAEPPMRAELEDAGATVHVVPMRHLTGSGGAGYWLADALRGPLSVLRPVRLPRRAAAATVPTNSLPPPSARAAPAPVRRPPRSAA